MRGRCCADWTGWLGALALAACLAGCNPDAAVAPAHDGTFSTVYADFKPAKEFERLGFDVDPEEYPGRISPRQMYGWKPFQGTLVLPADKSGCELVAQVVRHELERSLGGPCKDELTPICQRPRGRPFYGMLRYTQQGLRGYVYVWLFPDESETTISYAILVDEEDAANSGPALPPMTR